MLCYILTSGKNKESYQKLPSSLGSIKTNSLISVAKRLPINLPVCHKRQQQTRLMVAPQRRTIYISMKRLNHKQTRLSHDVQQRLCNFKCPSLAPFFFHLCSQHAQRKYDHGDVQSESNSDDNALGILQLLAWMLVHAAVGILQVIS